LRKGAFDLFDFIQSRGATFDIGIRGAGTKHKKLLLGGRVKTNLPRDFMGNSRRGKRTSRKFMKKGRRMRSSHGVKGFQWGEGKGERE